MARKRLLEDAPPAASSSTEEVEESEDDSTDEERQNGVSDGLEDEEHEADHQNKTPTSNKSTVTASSKALRRKSAADSDDESGSEYESESDKSLRSPSASDFTIKPIVSKPKEDPGKPQKNSAKRELTLALAAIVNGGKKGTKSDVVGKERRKNKSSNGEDEDSKRGSCIQRIWSEDDEIAILKGMIEYQSNKGADPWAEMEAFYGFIKKNLIVDVSKRQFTSKINRLKKKYQTLAEKGENGEDPVFSKPHDHKFFELAKKIWGAVVNNGVHDSAKKKRKLTQEEVKTSVALSNVEINEAPASSSSSFFDVLLPGKFLPLPEAATGMMKEALSLIGSTRITELESKWRKLQEDECELYLKRVKLVHDCAKVMLESMKSSTS